MIASKHYQDLQWATKNEITTAIKKDVAIREAIRKAEDAFKDKASQLVRDTASIVSGAGMNQGRRGVFQRNLGSIYALQRSEILDQKTCNYCMSVDGRVVDKKADFAQNDLFHANCRGMWVEIMKDEAEKPDIKGVPKDLKDKFGGNVNDLVQPRQPIVDKDSLARQFLR